MISQSEYPTYLARHVCGGYLTRHWIRQEYPLPPGENVWARERDPVPAARFPDMERGNQWLIDMKMTGFVLGIAPVCACCGEDEVVRHSTGYFTPYRCEKHVDRNPCAIEGCRRTAAATRLANNQHMCGEHWKRFVPPGSKKRQVYHRFWRIAKRQASPGNPSGWTMALARRFDRFWRALIRDARRQATAPPPEEVLDEDEIKRLFGWD